MCVVEGNAEEIACDDADDCLYHVGIDAEYCWIDQECPGTFLSLKCEGDLCICYDYDLGPVGTCANDVCVDGEVGAYALFLKAVECCGWQP